MNTVSVRLFQQGTLHLFSILPTGHKEEVLINMVTLILVVSVVYMMMLFLDVVLCYWIIGLQF